MAVIVGRPVHKVTIASGKLQTGGVRLGVCQMKKGRHKSSSDWLEDEVLILLAGMAAESHFTGCYCEEGARLDLLAARRLMQTRAKNQRQLDRLERRLLQKTEHELAEESHSRAVALIARELVDKQTISGRAVQHFFDQAQASK